MNNKKNILFISGSPRRGNTDYILSKIYSLAKGNKETILLREKKVDYCLGCLSCMINGQCIIPDDMSLILKSVNEADVLVVGSPNYFDNVPGMLKNFIDRTCPCLLSHSLKNKKMIAIIVGGGSIEHSKRVIDHSMTYFAESHGIEIISSHCIRLLGSNEAKDSIECEEIVKKITKDLNKL